MSDLVIFKGNFLDVFVKVVSKFEHDLVFQYHAKHQVIEEDLGGTRFLARNRQFNKLQIAVDILQYRNTKTNPCNPASHHFERERKLVAMRTMMKTVRCIVPFIPVASYEQEKFPICRNSSKAKVAEDIFEGNGQYFNLYRQSSIPRPCFQIQALPVKVFEEPEWDGQTWVNAKGHQKLPF